MKGALISITTEVDKDAEGKPCYVCKGRSNLLRTKKEDGEQTFSVSCLGCNDCKTAEYKKLIDAVNAWGDKILY